MSVPQSDPEKLRKRSYNLQLPQDGPPNGQTASRKWTVQNLQKPQFCSEENGSPNPKNAPPKEPPKGPKPSTNRAKMPLGSRLDRDRPESVEILKTFAFTKKMIPTPPKMPLKKDPQRGANRTQIGPRCLLKAVLTEISLKTSKSSKTFFYKESAPPPGPPTGPNSRQNPSRKPS